MIFERLIEKLLPTGRAWIVLPSKVMGAILGGLADELENVRTYANKVKDSIFPYLMDAEFISDWEKRFRLLEAPALTEDERRDRLAAQWQPGGQSAEFLETVLHDAGFDVYIKESAILADASKLGDNILGDFVLEGNVEQNQIVTECTSDNPNPEAFYLGDFTLSTSTFLGSVKVDPCTDLLGVIPTLGDFVLGDDVVLGLNKAKFIVNYIDDSLDPSETCPVIEQRCIYIFYIQGPGDFGDLASVPSARYAEFRELVLKHKPGHTWAACFLNLV